MRYVLNDPTAWAFDMSYMLYGALFMMAGAYTLSRGAHVRGDFIYRKWAPRTQARLDIVLYLIFYFPGVLAMVFTGAHPGDQRQQPGRCARVAVEDADLCGRPDAAGRGRGGGLAVLGLPARRSLAPSSR